MDMARGIKTMNPGYVDLHYDILLEQNNNSELMAISIKVAKDQYQMIRRWCERL